jgi:hypothetical protein
VKHSKILETEYYVIDYFLLELDTTEIGRLLVLGKYSVTTLLITNPGLT